MIALSLLPIVTSKISIHQSLPLVHRRAHMRPTAATHSNDHPVISRTGVAEIVFSMLASDLVLCSYAAAVGFGSESSAHNRFVVASSRQRMEVGKWWLLGSE